MKSLTYIIKFLKFLRNSSTILLSLKDRNYYKLISTLNGIRTHMGSNAQQTFLPHYVAIAKQLVMQGLK